MTEHRVEELWEAWERRDLAQVGRLSRLIAGGRHGPRKRDYWTATTTQPTRSEWTTFWKKPGGDGGMLGHEIDPERVVELECYSEPKTYNEVSETNPKEIEYLANSFRRAKLRRAVPRTSVPSEVWRMMLTPPAEKKQPHGI
eukprot:391826-Pyramimonas_sp.AAC.1